MTATTQQRQSTTVIQPSMIEKQARMDISEDAKTAQADDRLTVPDEDEPVEMEGILKALGPLGRYQIRQLLHCSFPIITFAFMILNFVFVGFEPTHTCLAVNESQLLVQYGLSNDSSARVSYSHCQINVNSNATGREENAVSMGCVGGYDYTGGRHVSMVTEWDLVCDKKGIVQFVQSAITLGMTVGCTLFTFFADRFGRRKVIFVCTLASALVELVIAFAPNVFVVIGLKFLCGATMMGVVLPSYVSGVELIISKHRQPYGVIYSGVWSCAIMVLALLGYLFRHQDWRHFQLVMPCMYLPVFAFTYFMNETPSWLFAKGRYEDAKRILKQACETSRKDVSKVHVLFEKMIERVRKEHGENGSKAKSFKEANYTLLDIFRNRNLLITVCILSFAWFSNSLIYYGIYLTSSALAGDRFLNFFLMAALELPSSLALLVMLIYLGRRTVLLTFCAMSGCCLLVSTILLAVKSDNTDKENASTAFFLLGKFTITACFNATFTYTPELFPTTIRSSGLGLCSTMARIAGMIAPFMLPLFQLVPWLPGSILTGLCLACFLLVRTLPETKGKQLPTTIEDFIALKDMDKGKANKRRAIAQKC